MRRCWPGWLMRAGCGSGWPPTCPPRQSARCITPWPSFRPASKTSSPRPGRRWTAPCSPTACNRVCPRQPAILPGERMLPRTLADDVQLRHGYTLAQVRSITLGLAKRQTWHKSTTVVSFDQRLEVAWHAIIEHLYASDQPPTPGEMMRAADRAVNRDVQLAHQFHGHKTHDRYAKTTTKGFELYWWHTASTAPSPENKVTERVALAQIWPRLHPDHQRVLAALAAHGDHGLAAASLGISRRLF